MIKTSAEIILGFGLLFFIVFGIQYNFLVSESSVRYNLFTTNLFFAISSGVICLTLLILETKEKFKPQLGFIYLPTLFIKGVLFFLIFQNTVFSIVDLTIEEKLHLIIPLFIFLTLEVIFVSKVINKK